MWRTCDNGSRPECRNSRSSDHASEFSWDLWWRGIRDVGNLESPSHCEKVEMVAFLYCREFYGHMIIMDRKRLRVEPIKEPSGGGKHPDQLSDVLPPHEFSMLMIAPRGCGKTTLILNLMTRMMKGYFHRIFVFSPTMAGDSKWESVKKMKGILSENPHQKELEEGQGHQKKRRVEEDSSDEDSDPGHGRNDMHLPSLYALSWQSMFAKVVQEPQKAFWPETRQDMESMAHQRKGSGASGKPKFTGRLKKKDMFRDYDEDDLASLMKETMTKIDGYRKKGFTKHYADRQLIIFDDLVGSTLFSAKKTNPFRILNTTLRHYSTSIMMVSQGYKEIPKTARVNATCVILFRIANEAEIKSIYEENSCGLPEKEWRAVYDFCTKEPFSFMLINYSKSEGERIWKNFDQMVPVAPQKADDRKKLQHDAAVEDERVPTGE